MAISFELQAYTTAPAEHVFQTMADLRGWGAYAGVVLVGPERALAAGDRVDARVRVLQRDIRLGCVIRSIEQPSRSRPGSVDIRSVDGPFDSRLTGVVAPTGNGCELQVEMHGIGRGAARVLERPMDLLMHHWASHQLTHLLARAEAAVAGAT